MIQQLACLLVAVTLSGCVTSQYSVPTQRQEYTFTTTEREVELGRRLAKQVELEVDLAADEPLQERVRSIGRRVVEVCDRKELVYHFAVVAEPEVNAFSLPGGYVYVNEGLIKRTQSDDELAAVIAHEIAHIAARHSVKRYESGLGAQLVQLVSLMASREAQAARGVSVAMHIAQLSYARQDELEADQLAVRYLTAAGLNPQGALRFLERLQDIRFTERPQYLPRGVTRPQYGITHPFISDRIRTVKEELFGVADYVDYLNSPE
ncbi:MAG: M48 family metalloprotease [Candidatus Omnitrophica bacterium]|nr:M48 family metalloprotease [Candidatus Omnitrophota bacterium]